MSSGIMSGQYHFITRWRVQGTAEEVFAILHQPLDYPRWWPSVYLSVQEVDPGDIDGKGRRVSLLTKALLPYQLRWESTTTEVVPPSRIALRASGEFDGRGIWSILQDGHFTDITFDWKLNAEKLLFRLMTPVLRPAFEANHRWAMEQGLKSLRLELERSRAGTVEQMNSVPTPAGPAELFTKEVATAAVLAAGVLAGLLRTKDAR
jgi:uncharacterized protein YndB with AHSA1/START domain